MKKITRSAKYFEFQQKMEELLIDCQTMWQMDNDTFDITCYRYGGGKMAIVQNFYTGTGISLYTQATGNKWDDVALAIAKSL